MLCWVLALAACGGGGAGQGAQVPLAQLGANLPGISDYGQTPVYVDLVHQARRFGSPDAAWDESATLGADGWPVGDFGIFLMTGQSGVSGTTGTYHVSFAGQARVEAPASAGASIANQTYHPATGRTTLELQFLANVPNGGDQLVLKFTQTQGGIKDLRVIRPGYDPANPPLFTRAFLDHIARFRTVRLMDWLRTNDNNTVPTRWADRATPDRVPYASALGVPWEHVAALASQTGQDIWINIPVGADDDYVRNLAQLLQRGLPAQTRVYVEYSNELWNGSFAQFGRNMDMARAELAANPQSPLAWDKASGQYSVTDAYTPGFRRIAYRLMQISNIFRSVYGDAAMMTRIRPVLAGQVVQPHIARVGLQFIDDLYGPPSRYFYALAGAPYFNLGSQQTTDGLDASAVLAALGAGVAAVPGVNAYAENRALATWYGLRWLAYEGGPDTFGLGSLAAKAAASLDPRMQGLCARYLQDWYQAGGELFMWFTAGAGRWNHNYGTWELTTDLAVTDTPKLRCLDAVLGAPAPATSGQYSVPGSLRGVDYLGRPASDTSTVLRYLHPGSAVDYLLHAAQAGTYTLVLTAEVDAPGNAVDIGLNGSTVATGWALSGIQGWGQAADQPPVRLWLNQGFNTLRLTTRTETTGYWLHQLRLR